MTDHETPQKTRQDAVLGLVFFTALALLLLGTLRVTNFSFRDKITLDVRFATAGGLDVGDPVFFLGKRVGDVQAVEIRSDAEGQHVRVVMEFSEPIDLRAGARIEISDANLLGGKRVEIFPGTGERLPPATTLTGIVKPNPVDALGDMVGGEENRTNLRGILDGLNDVVQRVNEGTGTLGKLVNDPALYDSALGAIDSARASLEAVRAGEGALGRLIHESKLGDDLAATVDALRHVIERVRDGEGLLATLVNDATLADDIRGFAAGVRAIVDDLRAGKGPVGVLLRDEETADHLRAIVADFRTLIAKANDERSGLLGALLADEQLLADGRGLLAGAREIVDKINRGEGALGRLISDEELGRRVGQILGQVQRAIEDAREAAPVGTFFQVLTGFF
jgi:phospholipid/cholesterol/gamma-HCH transport system substrate-binding protein